jgi:outer membrane receptor protein involved in Fe transport
MRKLSFLIILFFPSIILAQSGKIIGIVTDMNSGEPLPGANVIIEGTSLGTAADFDGNILLLNVNPGKHRLKASYIGYQDQVIENVRVSASLTTDVHFQLKEEVLESEAIVVVDEKPLINKNVTNSVSIITADDIEHLPLRSIQSIISQQAGVVNQGGDLYIRGSRMDQVAYYLDGVLVNDVLLGGATTWAINNAVEEIQVQAGGYSAEYGGANGGIISTHTKVGGENYHLNLELITDNFIPVGQKYLGGYSYGQSEYALTFSGPILPSYENLRFFIAANNHFYRSLPRFYIGIDEKGVYDPTLAASGTADTFDIFYPEGYRVNSHQNTYNIQGNLSWDLEPFRFRFNGSYKYTEGRNGVGINAYNNRDRAGMNQGETISAALKMTHVFSDRSFYDVTLTYFNNFEIPHMDPIMRHNITAYGDSIENTKIGTTLDGDSGRPLRYNAYGQSFLSSTEPYSWYYKRKEKAWGLNANLLYQLGRHNEIKFGVNYKIYEMRRYDVFPIGIASLAKSVADRDPRKIYDWVWHYGYDLYGNQSDVTANAPKKPVFAAFYIQDKLEYDNLVINAGIRFDYIFTDDQELVNPHNVEFDENDIVRPSSLRDLEAFTQWSPRLGFSFPVSEKTIFHAQYGKFFQQSRMRDIYSTSDKATDAIKNYIGIVGFGIKPEKTTQYEIGFRQQLGNNFAFDLTMFYKDIKDQVQRQPITIEPGADHTAYTAFVNRDFETVKGIELKLDFRRTMRVAGSVDYTFSDARGTGSTPYSGFVPIWGSPTEEPYLQVEIAPVRYNQAHRGSANIDYRFTGNDGGPILQRLGLNLLFQFASGFHYTRSSWPNDKTPVESLNYSTTPWTYRLDLKLDKSVLIGPVDVNFYVWITNVFNTHNVVQVYNESSDAFDDGWLASDVGELRRDAYARYGEDKVALFDKLYRTMSYNANHFGPPRQIRLGLRIDY